MTRIPDFITFTGADNWTDISDMTALSARYPIEWGVLYSPTRQGDDQRYPADPDQFNRPGLRLAAHLCGGHARGIVEAGIFPTLNLMAYRRVQINHREPHLKRIMEFSDDTQVRCIAQCPGAFPAIGEIDWLFDASGGRGASPAAWPRYPGRMVGYAGGIGPGNVAQAIASIAATGPYWIDMESGVRTNNRFDLAKVRAVCEAVYGRPKGDRNA